MIRFLALAAVGLLLAACPASVGTLTPGAEALVACQGYDSTLRALAGYNAAGRLSVAERDTVNRWRPILNTYCLGDPQSAGSALDQIEQAMFELILIQNRVEGG